MNQSNAFLRKIIYVGLMGALLIPLSWISRPAMLEKSGETRDPGGKLSQLRDEYNLSQAKLTEIDPASETMKLASLGLRGVAVNMLWMQAIKHKKEENYDALASTLEALTKIQPSFVKVWEFQAHNLAYNVSMEFDDYEYRYRWVKKGLEFLKKGIPYNKTDHRMTDNLGFFTGNKFGKSDERESFRRMFRIDNEFHTAMSDYIDPDSYDTTSYGHDSWKMAYNWYDYSRDLVEVKSYQPYISDMNFYRYRPAQLYQQAMALQEEYRTDDEIQEIWRSAHNEWLGYGQESISNTLGVTVTLEGMAENQAKLDVLRTKLDELVPGAREPLLAEAKELAKFSDEEKSVLAMPADQRDEDQSRLAREATQLLYRIDGSVDERVANQADETNKLESRRLVTQINRLMQEIRTIDKDSSTVNYRYWRARTLAESRKPAVRARQALHDASEMRRRSIYDDEFDVDFKTGERTITRTGAITMYLDAFAKWSEVLVEHPDLREGMLADNLVKNIREYQQMLKVTNKTWPEEFPLQEFIDFRDTLGEPDRLPTTEMLEDERSGREDDTQDADDNEAVDREESESEDNPEADEDSEN